MRSVLARIPLFRCLVQTAKRLRGRSGKSLPFTGSREYWERRYATGGTSGSGSSSVLADFKAEVLNDFVRSNCISSVIELGCGDGGQLALAEYPEYLGLDVSPTAIESCKRRFASDPSKSFGLMDDYDGRQADLAISLDVIFHLVEDHIFQGYMRKLFGAARRFVIIYSSDTEGMPCREGAHVRHRRFTSWVEENIPEWSMTKHIPNRHPFRGDDRTGSYSDFFVYERSG